SKIPKSRGQFAPAQGVNFERFVQHCSWTKVYARSVPESFQCAFDAQQNVVYIVPDDRSVVKYHLATGKEEVLEVAASCPATMNFSQLEYDPVNRRLVSFKIDEGKTSVFDEHDCTWSRSKPVFPKSVFWHYTSLFNPADTTIISFGGYGFYRYNNLMTTFLLNRDTIRRRELAGVMPRYSASSCLLDGKLYIYGGRGSETGKQEIATIYTYDLLCVDPLTGEVVKTGDFPIGNATFLPAANMVYDPAEKCFYVLTDFNGGRLARIYPGSGEAGFIAAPLPDSMSTHQLYRNLFHPAEQNKLYAVFDTFDPASGEHTLNIYSILHPPMSVADTRQHIPAGGDLLKYLLAAVAAGCLAGWLSVRAARRRRAKSRAAAASTAVSLAPARPAPAPAGETVATIKLLGGFSVTDRKGNNISDRFTPTLRELLILLITETGNSNKGLMGTRIDELLWGDKDPKAARNNRYVSIRKLRVLLEELGQVTIKGSNDYWTILLGEPYRFTFE
ncbi:MAG: kelch repeat-containing protein, partial [Rikenellaceae bacterium]|nr:kelch repeat-containing protein [Rikenellaceae bacterium]